VTGGDRTIIGVATPEHLLRVRATVHLAGVRPGDEVLVDPNDPWMAAKIDPVRGPLVPLDPWVPGVATESEDEPVAEAAPAAGDDTPVSALDDLTPPGE
jgi:hypothetical protein